MTCGLCGSGISADEKYKKLKNGKFNTHIYYGCTKSKDKNCKCGYINEVDLITQLQGLIDKIKLKDSVILKELKKEVARYKQFQIALSGKSTEIKVTDEDIRSYVKFILKDGDVEEKRAILENLNSPIQISNKSVHTFS